MHFLLGNSSYAWLCEVKLQMGDLRETWKPNQATHFNTIQKGLVVPYMDVACIMGSKLALSCKKFPSPLEIKYWMKKTQRTGFLFLLLKKISN